MRALLAVRSAPVRVSARLQSAHDANAGSTRRSTPSGLGPTAASPAHPSVSRYLKHPSTPGAEYATRRGVVGHRCCPQLIGLLLRRMQAQLA